MTAGLSFLFQAKDFGIAKTLAGALAPEASAPGPDILHYLWLVEVPADTAEGDPATERKVRDALLDHLAAGPSALVVDDAQWLDPASLRVLVGVVERAEDRGLNVTVAHRPAPGEPALAALDAAVARRHPLVVLTALDEDAVAERAALVTGRDVDQRSV